MTRRALLALFCGALDARASTLRCKLGDDEWMRRFRAFVRVFNAFVNALNDGKVNLPAWREMRKSWTEMADADE